MICTRLVLCFLMALFTACGVCAALFPIMRKETTDPLGHKVKNEISLWYTEAKYATGKVHYYNRAYVRQFNCGELRIASLAGAALDVVGCGLGAIATLIAAAHVCARVKFHLCCTLMVLCFVTFAIFMASVATVIFTFRARTCVNDALNGADSYMEQGYKLVEGFILLCVAAGGFFITIFLEICS